MSNDFHKLHSEQFEQATMEAHGAIVGWMLGNGEDPPHMTSTLKSAYERAFAVMFNSGHAAPAVEQTYTHDEVKAIVAQALHYAEGTISRVAYVPKSCGTCERAAEMTDRATQAHAEEADRA